MASHALHHVTAIAGPARRNLDFHTRVLGLRLVKRTVNFDDPGTHHLYYGDAAGSPGTILTFFPWAHAAPGRPGTGETVETAFRVPRGSLGWWTDRFAAEGVRHDGEREVFGEAVLPFRDPDGTALALVGVEDGVSAPMRPAAGVPAEHAIRGFHGVTLRVADAAPTAAVLTDALGLAEAGQEGALRRFSARVEVGAFVTLEPLPGAVRGKPGAGTVHHVAFRAADDADAFAIVERLRPLGIVATEQRDRTYFRSVYFREPGGVLFEVATDGPGFTVDEPAESLGSALRLPPQYEVRRAEIEAALPPLDAG